MAELSTRQRPFPLVPRASLVGGMLGERRSSHRGRGTDLAGTRPYRAGDPIRSIDWFASARLSAARDADEFVVREFFAEEAPRVFLVIDHGRSMRLYEPPLPWLSKRSAALAAAEAVAVSAAAARCDLGFALPEGVVPPGRVPVKALLARIQQTPFEAEPGDLQRAVASLVRRRALLTTGSFVFVVSDFLRAPAHELWSRLRGVGCDVVPVVVQDPVWEQSFPLLDGVTVPFADPVDGTVAAVRVSAREARAHAARNERRLDALLRSFRALSADPVVLGSSAPRDVDAVFRRWAERRRRRARSAA